MSECVSKVPHSFIMSSKCEEQEITDQGKAGTKKKKERRKETTEAGSPFIRLLLVTSCVYVFISSPDFVVVSLLFVWPP